MKRTLRNVISNEAIGFQWDKLLFTEIKIALQAILDKDGSNVTKDYSSLEKVIFDRIGILTKFKVEYQEYPSAGIYNPTLTRNNILRADTARMFGAPKTFTQLKLINLETKGWVDNSKVKVGGVFSKIGLTIELTTGLLNLKRLTIGEMSAVILHELGHAYYYFAALGQTLRTNMVLLYTMRELSGLTDLKQRIEIVEDAAALLELKLDDVESLASDENPKEILQTVIANESFKKLRNELGSSTYDNVTWEQLADYFAARQGAGVELVTGLDKIGANDRSRKNRSIYTRFVTMITDVTSAMRYYKLESFSILYQFMLDPMADAYDAPKVRLQRIREQLTRSLKDPTSTTEQKKSVLEDIATVDSIISELEHKYSFIQKLWSKLSPRGRRETKQVVMQRELEELLANRLFESAARFKTMV